VWPAGHHQREDRGHPPAHRVGRDHLIDRAAAHGADAVRRRRRTPAATPPATVAPDTPTPAIAAPQTTTAQMTMIPSRRACSIHPWSTPRWSRPPRRRRRAGRASAPRVDADREHGEERARHAEGHSHEVDRERAHEAWLPLT
jgi:hypothetical protein